MWRDLQLHILSQEQKHFLSGFMQIPTRSQGLCVGLGKLLFVPKARGFSIQLGVCILFYLDKYMHIHKCEVSIPVKSNRPIKVSD